LHEAEQSGRDDRRPTPAARHPSHGCADHGVHVRLDSPLFQAAAVAVPAIPDLSGTPEPSAGVDSGEQPGGDAIRDQRAGVSAMVRGFVVIAIACMSLLGQGERSRVDPRFISPSATLTTYWNAMRSGDAAGAW